MSPEPCHPERCAKLLAALAAPERLKIVRFLAAGSCTVGQIADVLGVPAVNVAHHLNVLRTAGLVRGLRRGRFVDYSSPPGVHARAAGIDTSTDVLDLGRCRLALPASPEPEEVPGSTLRGRR